MKKNFKFALVGATGLVGRTVIKILEEQKLPIEEYVFFASSKSKDKIIHFMNKNYRVQELTENSFDNNFDYAIFSAGNSISQKFAPIAVAHNTIVIDNSSAFRMDNEVPLIVPEVNISKTYNNKGIIANPNCSTIQAVVALKPLDSKYKIKRIVYSTYQAVSGAGRYGIEDLENSIKGMPPKKFPYPIFNNCLPHIDTFLDNKYTKEEMKMINETRKILDNPDLEITATTVRVPVFNCHCESINIEFYDNFVLNDLIDLLKNSPGIIVMDDISNNIYPIPTNVSGKDNVYVGRIRRDFSVKSGINLWVVADNIRKGAATNAVQILKDLINRRK